jgi:hypothetical protein
MKNRGATNNKKGIWVQPKIGALYEKVGSTSRRNDTPEKSDVDKKGRICTAAIN